MLFNLGVHQTGHHFIHIFCYLENRHVDFDGSEKSGEVIYLPHQLQLSLKRTVLQKRYVLNVNQNLVNRNIFLAAQLHLQLHAPHQDLVDPFVFLMKFSLFVIEAIEDILDVRNNTQRRREVVEQALIEDFHTTETLIDRFDLLQYKSFFDFLKIEHTLEQIGIPQFQEMFKMLEFLNLVEMPIGFEVIEQLLVEKYFSIDVLRHGFIGILNEVNCLSDRVIVMKLEYSFDGVVKSIL